MLNWYEYFEVAVEVLNFFLEEDSASMHSMTRQRNPKPVALPGLSGWFQGHGALFALIWGFFMPKQSSASKPIRRK